MPWSGRVAIIAPPHSTRTTKAGGEPGGGSKPGAMPKIPIAGADSLPRIRSKLLNMRDFRASEGFPSLPKGATIQPWQPGKSTGLAHFRRHGLDHAKRAIGLAKFRAYMLQTQP